MNKNIWDIYKTERRTLFTKAEMVKWLGKKHVEKLIRLKILTNCPIEKYGFQHKERCNDGWQKIIVKRFGNFYKECEEDTEIAPKRLREEEMDRLRLRMNNLFAIMGRRSGLKGGAKEIESYCYRIGVRRAWEGDYILLFCDDPDIDLREIDWIKHANEPDRHCIFLLPGQDKIYEWSRAEMEKRDIYLIEYEKFMDWKTLRVDVKGIFDELEISENEILITEEMQKECGEYSYKVCKSITITGSPIRNKKYEIILDGERIGIGLEKLKVLLKLAMQIKKDKNGWMKNEDIAVWQDNVKGGIKQKISALRKELGKIGKELIETGSAKKGYRLSCHPDLIRIKKRELREIGDQEISALLLQSD